MNTDSPTRKSGQPEQSGEPPDVRNLVVRDSDLTAAQRSAVHRLQVTCLSDVPCEELMEDFVAESFAKVLAYLGNDGDGSELVGCLSMFKREIEYEGQGVVLGGFGGTCTRADLRRRGIGTRVCRAAADLLREEGCGVAFLAAAPGTERFYGQFGFAPLGKPYTFVSARGVTKQPDTWADGMLAPVCSRVVFKRILRGRTPLLLGPEKGYW
jgi:predicted N-acetyltransferase YhbS